MVRYYRVFACDIVRVRKDHSSDYYVPGRGWVRNDQYYLQIFYAGDGDPMTEAEAAAAIAEQEAELVAA